jgi:hypothetical protein
MNKMIIAVLRKNELASGRRRNEERMKIAYAIPAKIALSLNIQGIPRF